MWNFGVIPRRAQTNLIFRAFALAGRPFFLRSLFTEDEGTEKLDYLFVDEAGQVSIANLVGMSRSAKNIILMGDQMQLSQPSQGSHPDESGQSILEYLLQDHATISDDLGIFLPPDLPHAPGCLQINLGPSL